MSSLLIKNASIIATMDGNSPSNTGQELENKSILLKNGIIEDIGILDSKIQADEIIDGKNKIVIPGLVNTHHHLFQTLTKSVKSSQDSSLFDWLKILYPIWANINPEQLKSAVKIGLSELILSGCTTSSDHLYIYPNGIQLEDEIEVANEIGIRFFATRGSMSVGVSKGGLPPDYLVEEEKNILKDSLRVIQKWKSSSKLSMINIALSPCSPFSVSEELMKDTALLAREYGVGLHTHLAENNNDVEYSFNKFGLSPGEYIKKLGWVGEDVWHAHCVKINNNEIKMFRETKTNICHCPSSNMRLSSGILPLNSLLKNRVNVSLGVDGSASNDSGNLLNEAKQCLLLQRVINKPNSISARNVLWMLTAGGAKSLNINNIGSIEIGNAGDLAIYDINSLELSGSMSDPLGGLVFCSPMKSFITICNGKVISKNGQIVNIDLQNTIENHNLLCKKLLSNF